MTSIAESMQGLNGDGWGTTMTKEEQLAHLEYTKKNHKFEDDREREMAEMRAIMGLNPESDHDSHLSSMKTSFIEGFLPKEKHNLDWEKLTGRFSPEGFKHIVDEIKNSIGSKHSEDMKNLQNQITELQDKVSKLEAQVVELSKPSFFGKISEYFSCLGRN